MIRRGTHALLDALYGAWLCVIVAGLAAHFAWAKVREADWPMAWVVVTALAAAGAVLLGHLWFVGTW